jgi:hypothetical protein
MQTATASVKPRRSRRLAAKAKATAAEASPTASMVAEALASFHKISAACATASAAVAEASKKARVAQVKKMDPFVVERELDQAWDWFIECRFKYQMAFLKQEPAWQLQYLKNRIEEAHQYVQEWSAIADTLDEEDYSAATAEAWMAELDKDEEF